MFSRIPHYGSCTGLIKTPLSMKIVPQAICAALLCVIAVQGFSQPTLITSHADPLPGATQPCISDAMYQVIEQRCSTNVHMLGLDHLGSQRSTSVPLSWPLRMANGLNDNSYYIISAYVDQDQSAGSYKDWNCGTNTYDTHRGTDICTYPYPFYKMDHNQVEVIAAAAGIIVDKHDGEFDKNCVHSSAQANYVVIEHADGTFANYFHMKKNSLTSKNIGDAVAAGEYLGIVGSSGDANGPHLHFEVRTANSAAAYKDPFAGGCNTLNGISWWAAQKTYTEPSILRAQIGATDPLLTSCPATETPNESPCLQPGSDARIYVFLRDETQGMVVNIKIKDSTGRAVLSWPLTSAQTQLASIYGWQQRLPSVQGTYTLEATYNNTTSISTFDITTAQCRVASSATGVADVAGIQQATIYPNPTSGKLTISGAGLTPGQYTVTLRNMLGQDMLSDDMHVEGGESQKELSVASLPDGIYMLTLEGNGTVTTQKIRKVSY